MTDIASTVSAVAVASVFNATDITSLERLIVTVLKDNRDGITSDELALKTPDVESLLRGHVVNKLLEANTIEMLQVSRGPDAPPALMLRLKRGTQIENATQEEQLVFSLIEESETKGIWIRDVRTSSGLTDTQLRKVLKVLEQRRLVKSFKAPGATKKCYLLYNLEPDESLTGGTFYSDQQLDSQFVQTLAQVSVNLLQSRRRLAEEMNRNDFVMQREASFVKTEEVAQYIMERGICRVHLNLQDVECILDVAVLDGRLERRVLDGRYRALRQRQRPTPLACTPCLHCPVQSECRTGHLIAPETCEYLKKYFDL